MLWMCVSVQMEPWLLPELELSESSEVVRVEEECLGRGMEGEGRESRGMVSQGCRRISSREGRSEARTDRHLRIRSRHSERDRKESFRTQGRLNYKIINCDCRIRSEYVSICLNLMWVMYLDHNLIFLNPFLD